VSVIGVQLSTLKKSLILLVVLVGLALIILATLKVNYVNVQPDGQLLWNDDDAYIFIGLADRGYRLSYLRYAAESIREEFPFGATSPTDENFSLLVLHVTPSSIDRYSIANFRLGEIEPSAGALYVSNLMTSKTVRWAATHFEDQTPDEQKQLQDLSRQGGLPSGPQYDNIQGWSKRTIAGNVIRNSPTDYTEKNANFTITLKGQPLTFEVNSGFIGHRAYVSVVAPGGQSRTEAWSLDENSRRVGAAEYKQMFPQAN